MSDLFIKVHDDLPVFRIDAGEKMVLYTPGYFLKTRAIPLDELRYLLQNPGIEEDIETKYGLQDLLKKAGEAKGKWEIQRKIPFSAECLTIHVGNECNLDCSYCYSKKENTGNKDLSGFPDIESIELIFNHIAHKLRGIGRKVTVVYHGSGEPSFHWKKLVESFNKISLLADRNNLQVFNYIASNGSLTKSQAYWLASNMNLIGISCDGPPDIQEMQRARSSKKYLSTRELCNRITSQSGRFELRVTITKDTINRQKEITRYLIDELNAETIRIEPVYLAGDKGFKEEDADVFFDNYIKSRNYAKQKGVKLYFSGVRLNEIHGTYCDVLRNTLRLTPDGLTRNCFCYIKNNAEFVTGRCLLSQHKFYINSEINELKIKASQIPNGCNDCINIFHCSRGCPDFCIFREEEKDSKLNSFRCRLHKLITVEEIISCTI
jgi:sulfatase maturation enzyme AslB (radical SAM superfamily)